MWLTDALGVNYTQIVGAAKILLTAGVPATMAYFVARYQYKSLRKDKKNVIIGKYVLPLLTSSRELENRLTKVLGNLETDWLDKKYIDEIKCGTGFAENPTKKGYFVLSTIYLFAKFFSLLEIISQEVGHVYDLSTRQEKEFEDITNTISRIFQYREMWGQCETVHKILDSAKSNGGKERRDAWRLHRQFQHSIGELLIHREGDKVRSMSFKEFFERYVSDKTFRYWCDAIEDYVVDLSCMGRGEFEDKATGKGDIRIFRIIALRYWLLKLMRSIEKDINVSMSAAPETALDCVPLDIQSAIKNCSPSYQDAFFTEIN